MKKNILIFVGGFICGIIALLIFQFALENRDEDALDGLELLEQKGECITTDNAKVIQVISLNAALAVQLNKKIKLDKDLGFLSGVIDMADMAMSAMEGKLMLVLGDENQAFYDNEEIKLPKDKCFRKAGIYQYETKDNDWKTIPAVKID
ncbi:MAG: hypothetical protein K5838_02235 [Elusimicrobiales bacterium]|nr:hypothetical protein [Elusimicrobiales bacterium]